MIAERLFDVAPPEKLILPCDDAADALAVMVLPDSPKLTLFELEKVTADRLLDVPPADTLMLVSDVATLPVIVLPLSPKLTPLEFENVTALKLFDVAPAEKLMLP